MRLFILKFVICFLLLTGITANVSAQWLKQQQLTQNIYLHNLAHPSPSLFVHFDKTIYTNNETVWFTGYLLKCSIKDLSAHQVMSVALVRDIDSNIVKQAKYVMDSGFSYGTMILPDTMTTGNYHFQVTTNRVSKEIPEVVYLQPIIIKTNIELPFSASLKLIDKGTEADKSRHLLLSVTSTDARLLPKPAEVTYKYGNIYKKAKTNASGELVFTLKEEANFKDPNIYAKIKYGKDSTFINLPLLVSLKRATVNFYPEGGNLINAIPGYVAWEVRDEQAGMVSLKAQLYKDDEIIDTIETNSYGIGKFILIPQMNSKYKVRLLHSGFADSTYYLPEVTGNGISLMVKKAVEKDTVSFILRTTQSQKISVRIHDFKDTYIYNELVLNARLGLKIPLENIPKGLQTITISDSLGRPLAERMFFAHYDPESKLSISTDKESYGQRQKVILKLKLSRQDTLGIVSVACVQNNRLSSKLTTDIESYVYLNQELDALPLSAMSRKYSDKDYIEDILMVKGWRRYTWKDMMEVKPADTLKRYDSLQVRLVINRFGKSIKKPVNIGFIKDTALSFKTSDQLGGMLLDRDELSIESDKKIMAFVSGKNQLGYAIKEVDPYIDLNKKYLKTLTTDELPFPSAVVNNNELSLKNNEKAISLKEVKITSSIDRNINFKSGPNACGDYVCVFNILNCQNHRGDFRNTQPVPGQKYRDGQTGGSTVYRNCENAEFESNVISVIPGIYTKKEFYVNDFSQPLEPAFVSTIYWNHSVIVNNKDQDIEFYTSDITGKFKVVVQGVSNNGLIYGEDYFEVKTK